MTRKSANRCHPKLAEESEPKTLKAVCSKLCNTDCIRLTREPTQTRSATRQLRCLFAQGDTKDIIILLRVRKPRFSESAPSSSRSAALSHRPLGQCSHAHSAPPLPKNLTPLRFSGTLFKIHRARKITLFRSATQFAETFRLLGKGVNVRDFYNGVP